MKLQRIGTIKKALLMAAILAVFLLVLSSCSLFNKTQENIIAPKLNINSPPRIERVNPDFYNPATKQNEVYTDIEEGTLMPVNSGEKVHVVLDYVNPSNLKINKVVLTGDGQQFEILSKDFLQGSDSNQTKFEFEIGETSGEITYTVSKVFYNLGASVLSMTLNQNYVDIPVVVNPKFKLKLDYQNYDARTDTKSETKLIDVDYHQSLSDIIPSLGNQSTHQNTPAKLGGWAFMGYYTQPNGNGAHVTNTANYYFWKNTTLYAHYSRLYEFTLANATYDIPDGKGGNYKKFATITKKTAAGDAQENLEIYDTIADDDGEYPIVSIESGALANTFTLHTLKIGKYVKYIGKNALDGSKVVTVEFHPEGVLEKIDNRAFYGTSKLGTGTQGFTLPSTVKFLGDRCFNLSGWGKMIPRGSTTPGSKLIIYPELTHIGNWCFVGTAFTEVIFMPGVKFKSDAVDNVPYVEEINGQPVTADSDYYLGWCLFKNTESIKKFSTLSDEGEANGLEVITDGMFDISLHSQKQNVGLDSVSFAEGLKVIGKGAFQYQKRLSVLNFPDSLEDIGGAAFVNGKKDFPGTKDSSEFGAFAECSSVETVIFSENSQLKVIGASAFRNNRLLTKFEIKSKVLEFYGDGPFQGCTSLTEVFFSNDSKTIVPQPLVYDRSWLENVSREPEADLFYPTQPFKVFVKDIVVEEMRDSFSIGAGSIIMRSLPVFSEAMIKDLGDGRRAVLEMITIDAGKRQGWSMGYYLGGESKVVLPDEFEEINIIQIGSYAFSSNVEKIRLPENIVIISAYAFSGCKKLNQIKYGGDLDNDAITELGKDALEEIGNSAFFNTAITSFKGGNNLSIIDESAFQACESLVWVDLKDSTKLSTGIGKAAFSGCIKLRYVRLPNTFNSMADATFAKCVSLKYLVLENSSPLPALFNKVSSVFQDVPSNYVDVYVLSQAAIDVYNGLENLPSTIKNRFKLFNNEPGVSPDPGDFQGIVA